MSDEIKEFIRKSREGTANLQKEIDKPYDQRNVQRFPEEWERACSLYTAKDKFVDGFFYGNIFAYERILDELETLIKES